jgi:hypothetical protein
VDTGWSSKSSRELSVTSGRKTSLSGDRVNLKAKRRQEREEQAEKERIEALEKAQETKEKLCRRRLKL